MPSEAEVLTCATVGNCGPGFDMLSLALADAGDRIHMAIAEQDEIVMTGPGADAIPTAWDRNIAGAVVNALRAAGGPADPVRIAIKKPRAAGSGLGSSAASASGTALAYGRLFGDLSPEQLLAAADAGEALAGGGNGDDIAAVIYGGLVIADPANGIHRVQPPGNLHVGVVVPDLSLETETMRALLPDRWPREAVVRNMAKLAKLIDACHRDDVAAFGDALDDELAVPFRRDHWPDFEAARSGAIDAGATGACIAGSGPAMFAVADTADGAADAASAMREVIGDASHFTVRPEYEVPYVRLR